MAAVDNPGIVKRKADSLVFIDRERRYLATYIYRVMQVTLKISQQLL